MTSKKIVFSSLVLAALAGGAALATPVAVLADTGATSSSVSNSYSGGGLADMIGQVQAETPTGVPTITGETVPSDRDPNVIYSELTPQQKAQFRKATANLSQTDKAAFLQLADNSQKDTRGVKSWLIKTALTQAAKMAGKYASASYIEYTALKISGALDQSSANMTRLVKNFLIGLGVPSSTAQSIASVAVWIMF